MHANRSWMILWAILEAVGLRWAGEGRSQPAAVVIGHLEARDIRHLGWGYGRGRFVERRRQLLDALATPQGVTWMARGAGVDRYGLVGYIVGELGGGQPVGGPVAPGQRFS